jgi:biofilm PGA synthesis N-glycosyltransferase PgaC
MDFWQTLTCFVALYPLYMSFLWATGGLLFYFRWERITRPAPAQYPMFSIIIGARNEEQHIEEVVRHLSALDYPRYEVLVVNDGSTDATGAVLDRLSDKYHRWLTVIHLSPNSGKARAVNTGILFSRGEIILVLDADCFIDPAALKHMAWHFEHYTRVGAVTGNPRISNRTSLLGKLQVGEYSSIIGLIKRTQRIIGKVLTVSGVIAAYRKCTLCDAGLFDSDTVTEDIDVTWKLQNKKWEVRYEPKALCYILSPETVKGLWKQRVRWAQGGVEVVKKHYDIWSDWKRRRFWPIYTEYVLGIIWAFSLAVLAVRWLAAFALFQAGVLPVLPGQPFLPPPWAGSVLALVCLLQFSISFFIDSHYETKDFLKYYFWIIWYPLFYWLLNAFAVYVGVYNVFIRRGGVSAVWKSPDRGLHTIKSSTDPK